MQRQLIVTTLYFLVFLLLFFFTPALGEQENRTIPQIIHEYCIKLAESKKISVCSTCVNSQITIPAFYRSVGYQPVWLDTDRVSQFLSAIDNVFEDGLIADDYYQGTLIDLYKKLSSNKYLHSSQLRAEFDILMTDALLRLAYHLFYGKLNPESLDPDWNLHRSINNLQPEDLLKSIIFSGDIVKSLERLRPQLKFYHGLKKGLALYLKIKERGGWPRIPSGKMIIKPGSKDKRISLIAKRIMAEGINPEGMQKALENDPDLYSREILTSVRLFQNKYGLQPDGIIGKETFKALWLNPDKLIDRIRVNLERSRWVLHDLPAEFILVNIASYQLYWVRQNKIKWKSRVQVGTPKWQTPVFRADLKFIVFNPFWNVPPGIFKKEIYSHIVDNPLYLKENNMEVVDFKGNPISAGSIDWGNINASNPPFIVRQKPGPDNALGRVKFVFPNKHFIFIHDTPNQAFFKKDKRSYSHGCIRLQHPMELAKILLKFSNEMDEKEIYGILEKGEKKVVRIKRNIPVLILYWTAEFRNHRIRFFQDIYQRDPKILIGLDTPPAVDPLGKL